MADVEQTVICCLAYKCRIRPCVHAIPHERRAGCTISAVCHSADVMPAVCLCVKVQNGKYRHAVDKSCPHCGGRGRWTEFEEHPVPGEETDETAAERI